MFDRKLRAGEFHCEQVERVAFGHAGISVQEQSEAVIGGDEFADGGELLHDWADKRQREVDHPCRKVEGNAGAGAG